MGYRIRREALLLGLLVWPAFALAQGPGPAPNPGKIGVINIQEAIASTAEGKKSFADIDKKFQPRRQELQRLQQEIQALSEQLQKQASTLSDDEQRRLSRDVEEKNKLLKRSTEDASADYQGETQDAGRRIGQKLVRLLGEYAQQNGFVLVMESGPQMPIYYAAPQIDLTEEMIRRYDAANPVEGAGTSEPAPPSTPRTRPAAPIVRPPAATRPTPKPAEKPK